MKGAVVTLLAGIAAGCAGGVAAPLPRTYDFGVAAPAARVPAVRVTSVRTVVPFDGLEMHYRLAWRNAAELVTFSQSRWAAPPGELLRKHLLRATGEGVAKCGLEVELHEFSQVFASPGASDARLELHAALVGPKGRLAARGWNVEEANAGADAASGAAALARAADRAVTEIAGWIAAQADCR